MHKQIAESRNLNERIEDLVSYIRTDEQKYVFITPRPIRKNNAHLNRCDGLIPIQKQSDERTYRQRTKMKIRKYLTDLEGDIVFDKLPKSQFWTWLY